MGERSCRAGLSAEAGGDATGEVPAGGVSAESALDPECIAELSKFRRDQFVGLKSWPPTERGFLIYFQELEA